VAPAPATQDRRSLGAVVAAAPATCIPHWGEIAHWVAVLRMEAVESVVDSHTGADDRPHSAGVAHSYLLAFLSLEQAWFR
jgi:hypothetical protein